MMSDALSATAKENHGFLWPVYVRANNLSYTKEDLAAWKQRHINSDRLIAVYTTIAAGEKPNRTRAVWGIVKTFLPIITLAVLANFANPLSVVLFSCVALPMQGVTLFIFVSTVVYAAVIRIFTEIERNPGDKEKSNDHESNL